MPERELIAASLALRAGAVDEPADVGGATVLAARGLTEGTEVRDAIALVEAAERLGASIHAESGWDATSAGLDVPASRLAPALELLAEVVRRPSFPEAEIERLRDERLTDLLQAKADPRRRADEAYVSSIYAAVQPVPPARRRGRGDGGGPHVRRAARGPRPGLSAVAGRPGPRRRRGPGRGRASRRGAVRRLVRPGGIRPGAHRRHRGRHVALRARRPPPGRRADARSGSGTAACRASTRTTTRSPS